MRRQAESGLDEYAPFDQIWYAATKNQEPNIDDIIDSVFEAFKLNAEHWSKSDFMERIKK